MLGPLTTLPRVLSLQSHVVSGYVGNRAAVFPLQLLGFDVDFINSVQYSNNSAYQSCRGSNMTGSELSEVVAGLEDNGLLHYDWLLTGYIGAESVLEGVPALLDKLLTENPTLKYFCDPVMGDHGEYYVPEAMVKIFIDKIVPRAYMIKPNQFEAELLTGVSIHTETDVVHAITKMLLMGPQVVVLSSSELEDRPGRLSCYAARKLIVSDDSSTIRIEFNRIEVEKVNAYFTGTGDATSALMLAWTHILSEHHLGTALRNTLASIKGIVSIVAAKQTTPLSAKKRTSAEIRSAEFCVVEGKSLIENPPLESMPMYEQWEISVPVV